MILLDTNVVSEAMKPRDRRDARVFRWLDAQPRSAVFTSVFTIAEILFGVAVLPAGAKRNALAVAAEIMLRREFDGRVLGFDEPAARAYASIAANRRRAGRHLDVIDTLIASVAHSRGLQVATRNVEDYRLLGVLVIDPWTVAP